jgi:hypothetical protein
MAPFGRDPRVLASGAVLRAGMRHDPPCTRPGWLIADDHRHGLLEAAAEPDRDADGAPDIYESGDPRR